MGLRCGREARRPKSPIPAALHTQATGYLAQLRYYFDVNNSYVTQKLKVLALPFRHKEWARQLARKSPPGSATARPPGLLG